MTATDASDPSDPTALEAMHPLATSQAAIGTGLVHREVDAERGLLSALIHEPTTAPASPTAIVMCGGGSTIGFRRCSMLDPVPAPGDLVAG